jgi:hypothetical protein
LAAVVVYLVLIRNELVVFVLLRFMQGPQFGHNPITCLPHDYCNFTHATEFIERIETEARTNERLREVMRGMYPPREDAGIERRFRASAEEPTGDYAIDPGMT